LKTKSKIFFLRIQSLTIELYLFAIIFKSKRLVGINKYFLKHEEDIEEVVMPEIMTTKELAEYLKLHEITVCKHAAEGIIPAIRIGRVWRFDKEAIDEWINGASAN
jgi:excisionase family DNA binding protein